MSQERTIFLGHSGQILVEPEVIGAVNREHGLVGVRLARVREQHECVGVVADPGGHPELSPGDCVMWRAGAGTSFRMGERSFLSLNEDSVLAVVEQ